MKNTILASTIALLSLLPVASFADQTDCDTNSIECTYFTGLNEQDLSDGRYLKIQISHGSEKATFTMCSNNTLTSQIDSEDAPDLLGNTETVVSICSDKDGSQCEVVKDFTVQLSKINNTYIANPARTQVDLSSYTAKYTRCDATQNPDMKHNIFRHR